MQIRFVIRTVVAMALVFGAVALAWASPHDDYMRGMTAFKALLADEKKAALRDEWHKVLTVFEKSLAAAPKGEDAPKCMYFIGRVHEEVGRRSFLKSDREKALAAFERMIAAYPNHGWTDDSLYREGLIWKEQFQDPARARSVFESVVARYSKGDMAPDAAKHLAALGPGQSVAAASPATKSASAAPAVAKSAPAVATSKPGTATKLLGIRCWPSQGYTRVVLDLDKDAAFERAVEERDGKRFLVLSLPSAVVAPDVIPSRGVGGGVLSRIEALSSASGGARVTLDLLQMDHFRAFTLPDPYRIVVDVFGTKSKKTGHPAAAVTDAKASPATSAQTDPVVEALRDLKHDRANAKPEAKAPAPTKTAKGAPASRTEEKKATTPQIAIGSKHKKYAGSLVEQLGLTVRTVMIDPGHGGKDPGAMANGVREKDVNLRMAKIVGRLLQNQGFEVHYTRTTDTFISLEERTARANARDADLFISVHCNAYSDSSVKGLEIYYLNLATDAQSVRVAARENGVSAKKISDMQFILSDLMLNSKINESKDMASLMQKETLRGMRSSHGLRNMGSKGAFFYVLTGARMPSVLVELGYLTNPAEAGNLKSEAYLTAMAKGLVGGVVAYKKKLERYASAGGGKS
ncbi:MAG: N-acetylmuramoyl-L-alanine amidase [Deltaproteobacteria bacterium]|nr:N-acetylmuramoyl-L-alanine amidase [Deltaproteobacteria bacterium]